MDTKNNRYQLIRGVKSIDLSLNTHGADLFKRDLKKARDMIQRIANFCLDVDAYLMVSDNIPIDYIHSMYVDEHRKCVKQIEIGENHVLVERYMSAQ